MSANTDIGNTPVNQGYVQLIHTGETAGIDGNLRVLYDGDGTASDLSIASNKVKISTPGNFLLGTDTITEFIQDVVGAMLTTGSYTNVSTNYDNTNGNIDISSSGDTTASNTLTFTNKTIDADNNTLSNIEVDNFKSGVLDTDISSVAGTHTTLASAKAIKTYVDAEVADIVNSAPSTLDTLDELASALGDDANFATTTATSLGQKLVKASNLSDLTNVATARTNLGVDVAGTDNSTNVTLAGSLDYLTLSGQEITRNAVNLTTDITGTLPVANGGTGATSLTSNALLTGNGTSAIQSESNLLYDAGVLFFKGTDPSNTYGIKERIRLQRGGNNTDRQLQFYEQRHSGGRHFIQAFNTTITTDNSSAYTYTQGLYGGSSQIRFQSSGDLEFYNNAQGTGGSQTTITPSLSLTLQADNDAIFGADLYVPHVIYHVGDTNTYIQLTNDRIRLYAGGSLKVDTNETYLTSVPNHSGNLITSGTVASAYLDADTAHLSGTQTFSGAKTFSSLASFTMDGNTITGIDDSGEFTNDDAHIMTSAAVEDKILGYGYITQVGIDQILAADITDSTESFSDSDDLLMTAKAINDRIESFGYGTGNGDMTGVSITASNPLDISQSNTTSGSYSATISLDASEFGSYLADMTDLVVGGTDELAVLDNGTLKRKQIDEIRLTAFDSTGFSSGISFDGSTANGVLTFKDSDEATVESSLIFTGSVLELKATSAGRSIEVGSGATGDITSFVDLIGDTTYSDYGARFIRFGGANATTDFRHRGTGDFRLIAQDSAALSLQTASAERLRITSAGKVGIGTNSPSYKLDITHTGIGLRLNSSGDQQLRFERSGGNAFSIEHDASRMYLYNRTTSAATVAVTNAGNFGIGTVSPGTKLHVKTTGSGSTSLLKLEDNARLMYLGRDAIAVKDLSGSAAQMYINSNTTFSGSIVTGANIDIGGLLSVTSSITTNYGVAFTNGNTNFLQYNNSGEDVLYLRDTTNNAMLLTYGTTRTTIHKNTRHGDQVEFEDTNAVINRVSNDLEIRTYGGYDINLMAAGNVGIGTTSGAAKLHVQEAGTGAGSGGIITETATHNGNAGIRFRTSGTDRWAITTIGTNGASLRFRDVDNGTDRVTFDGSGNVTIANHIDIGNSYKMDGTIIIDSAKIPINIGDAMGSNRSRSVLVTDYAGVTSPTASGWYTIASASSANARGGGTISIGFTGGYYSPRTFTCDFEVDWSGNLNRCNIVNRTNDITKVRIIETGSTTELQAYFSVSTDQGNNTQSMRVMFTRDKYNPNWSIENPLTQESSPSVTGEEVGNGRGDYFYGADINTFGVYNSNVVFNEHSKNCDFRVESNGDANMLFVDGGNNRVGIGTGSPDSELHVVNNTANLKIESTGSGNASYLHIKGTTNQYDIFNNAGNLQIDENGVATRLLIEDGTGRIAVGHNDPDALLHINPGNALCNIKMERQGVVAWRFGIDTNNADLKFDAGDDALGGPEVLFTTSGAGHFDNDVVAFSSSTGSDRRLKENIKPISYGLKEVLQINPVEYDWKEKRDKAHDIGVIAQEIEEIIPEIVKEHKDLKTEKEFKTVDYGKMVSVLIKAIQEQQQEIEELKKCLKS